MAAMRAVVEQKAVFCALYSDRASHFFVTPKAGEPVGVSAGANRQGVERIERSDDSGVFTASAGAERTELWDLARTFTGGTAPGLDHYAGTSQPVL
jgi:hypothetical protein